MNQTQKEAWITLKTALDKYSQATGAEVSFLFYKNTLKFIVKARNFYLFLIIYLLI